MDQKPYITYPLSAWLTPGDAKFPFSLVVVDMSVLESAQGQNDVLKGKRRSLPLELPPDPGIIIIFISKKRSRLLCFDF